MHTRPSIQSRIDHLEARIRDTRCPRSIAVLVDTMTAHRDVEAIPALVGLLDLPYDRVRSVERALVRYGEAAQDSLRAYVLTHKGSARMAAIYVLGRIARRARIRRLGCF